MDINAYSVKQLKQEIIKREEKEKEKEKPKFLTDEKIIEQFKDVKSFLDNNMDSIIKQDYPENNFQYYSFETLLELFYGSKIWEWYNKYNKGRFE